MNRQKLVCIFSFILLISFCLSGCKQSVGTYEDNAVETDEEEKETDEEEKEDILKIGFSVIDMENPYFLSLENAIKQELDQSGQEYELITKDPGGDASLQGTQILELLDEGIETIVLTPVDWEAISPSLLALSEAGVHIVNVDTQVKDMEYVDAYIGSDNYQAGVLCGEDLIEKCPEGGNVAILESPTQNSVNERISGFEETIAAAESGFTVVAREDTNGSFETALDAMGKILSENQDLVAIMCGNDQLAVAAQTQVNVNNITDVLIYGVDGSPDIKKEFEKNTTQVAGTVAQSLIEMGTQTAKTALAIHNGETYEKEYYLDVFMINKDNVELYGVDGWQ